MDIRCRAWHKKEKVMYFFNWETVTQTRHPGYYNPYDVSGDPVDHYLKDCELTDKSLYSDVMFFTGLHDKNNKEVYHLDVCDHISGLWIVEWQTQDAKFTLQSTPPNALDLPVNLKHVKRMLVIGHLYDPPYPIKPKE